MSTLRRIRQLVQAHTYPRVPTSVQRRLSQSRLQRLIRHTWAANSFYRERWRAQGMTNADDVLNNFHNLSTVSKAEIAGAFPNEILTEGYRLTESTTLSTTGSSGVPLRIFTPEEALDRYLALQFRTLSMVGVSPLDRVGHVALAPFETGNYGPFFRQRWLPLTSPRTLALKIVQSKTTVLFAYPYLVLAMARELGIQPCRSLGLKAVVVNSDLTTPEERDEIADAFGCPVGDDYASYEVWTIANLCGEGRYHVSTDNVLLEILDDDDNPCPDGVAGRVVVTSLTNHGMPFVRYEQGDLAVRGAGRCRCGRTTPLLDEIVGRRDDAIALNDGTFAPGAKAHRFLRSTKGHLMLGSYQLIQSRAGHLELQFSTDTREAHAAALRVRDRLAGSFGERLTITTRHVEALDSGVQRKCVVSKFSTAANPAVTGSTSTDRAPARVD